MANRAQILENNFWQTLRDHFKIADGYLMDYHAMTLGDSGEPLEFGHRVDVPNQSNALWLEFTGISEQEEQFVGMFGFNQNAQILVSLYCTKANFREKTQNFKKDIIDFFEKNVDFGGACAEAKIKNITFIKTQTENRWTDALVDIEFVVYQERA